MEDVPSVGKTTLANPLARAFDVVFSRVQFTNALLADELNRASPRTQSTLLEARSEAQVTIDGETHPLPRPFFVLATQNPHEFAGTYPRGAMEGRSFVAPGDIQALAVPVAHRVQLTLEARYGGQGTDALVLELLRGVRAPL